MRFIILALAFFVSLPVVAAEGEFELKLYLQPDTTGQNTLNKSVRLRDGKELDLDGDDLADTNSDGQSPYEVISNLLRTQNPTDAQGVPYFMFYLHTDGIDPESIFDHQVSVDQIKA